MRIGIALIMGAAGAILRFAVEPSLRVAGTFVNWDVVGDILLVAGIVGVIASMVAMAASGRRTTTPVGTTPTGA
jgi:hypothetical protein